MRPRKVESLCSEVVKLPLFLLLALPAETITKTKVTIVQSNADFPREESVIDREHDYDTDGVGRDIHDMQ